jgi:uncharacterized protein
VTDEWPADTLDVDALTRTGWHAVPFQQFVLKLHGRCNIACTYCYMYQTGDRGWLSRPRVMSPAVIRTTSRRIAEHAERHGLPRVEVALHGGEPLLAGPVVLADVATELRAALPPGTGLDLVVQTNGILLDEAVLDVLAAHRIRVGVSVDGADGTHDRRRRYANGRGSYADTARGLRLLGHHRELFAGVLAVIDLADEPVATYEALLEFAPPRMDFLMPHGNWSAPPPHKSAGDQDGPYGRWLTAAFDRWYGTAEQETEVRLFAEIINLVLGGQSRTESVGLSPVALVTVNTDGSLEQVDSLRSAYRGAVGTGLNVATHTFDDVLRHPSVVARQLGLAALAESCQQCGIRRVCGGGHYVHRYRRGTGFRNPSIYCPDLTTLITHIAGRVSADLASLAV